MTGVSLPLIALYIYDDSILDGLKVPTDTDLDPSLEYVSNRPSLSDADLRDLLLATIGEMTPLYTRPDILKEQIEVWARAHKPEWTKLWQSMIYKYNPIWNKDGSYTEEREVSGKSSGNTTNTYGRTDTNNVTGYDTNGFSPNTQNVAGGQDKSANIGDYTTKEKLTRREAGNIGVTTTMQMIREEREIAVFNIYEYIIEAFKNRFMILLY